MTIKLSQQVAGFVRGLSPEPRRKVRLALKALSKGAGDIKPLEGALASYSRLRISSYRIILFFRSYNQIECVFAERRSIVYEIFAQELRETLAGKL
jgi:mRNA-degrading endonuclease RelE of RelBE toxin-antitoxin system